MLWNRSRVAWASLVVAAASSVAPAAEPGSRPMFFLARDAVVRQAQAPVELVGPGRNPSIVVGRGTAEGARQRFENRQMTRAGNVLAQAIQKITGLPSAVAAEGTAAPGAVIHVGAAGDPRQQFPELAKADDHGFVIARQGDALHIVGASGTGTLYGVWFFLTNYAGVRQVLPGEDGTIYPPRASLEIPADLYVLNPGPDFKLRIWSGNNGLDQEAWLADANTTQRFDYHHAAGKIYDPAKYGQSNPEYFPVVGGKPVIPPGGTAGWQPTFSEPATVRRAIDHAREFFTASPWMRSVSVTVNDGGGYSERDYLAAQQIPGGQGRLSDVYFNYVNQVARDIRAEFPDKYVACLAYMAVEAPPAFAMEDNVLVFAMNEPREIMARWGDKARHWGIYMWLFGQNWWVVPNHWPHALQEALREMRGHGFEAFKAEVYGRWIHDGPKTWVLCNLLWNVDADVDALLRDYFEHTYGPQAAPAVARYFAQAEAIHARRRSPQRFNFMLDLPRGGYRPRDRQLAGITAEDVRLMGEALAEAGRAVTGDLHQRRVAQLQACFEWWRSYWEQQQILTQLQTATVTSEAQVQQTLAAAVRFFEYRPQREALFRASIEPYPQVAYASRDAQTKVAFERLEAEIPWIMADHAICLALEAISSHQRRSLSAPQLAKFWDEVAKAHPELAEAIRLQRVLGVYPERAYKQAIGDGTLGAAVNACVVDQLRKSSGQVTPDDVARSQQSVVSRLTAEVAIEPDAQVGPQAGRIAISRRSAAPTIDGKLDDPAWATSPVAGAFFASKMFQPARYRTDVRLLHDDTHLFVGIRAWQDTAKLRAAVRFRDMKVWEDDSVEMMLCLPDAAQPAAGVHVIINALGTIFDQMDGESQWNGQIEVATSVDAEGYSVELAVPLRDLGVEPAAATALRVNFARGAFLPGKLDARNPWDELSSWYPHHGDNIDPRFKGWLIFSP